MFCLVGATFFEQISGEFFYAAESCLISDHAAVFRLLNQARRREKSQVMCQRRCGHIEPFLDLTDIQAIMSCADESQQNFKARLGTYCRKSSRGLFKAKTG